MPYAHVPRIDAAQASCIRRNAGLRNTSLNAAPDSASWASNRRTRRRIAVRLVYLKRRGEDSGELGRPVCDTGNPPRPSGRRSSMAEESFEKDQQVEETDDVEAHK